MRNPGPGKVVVLRRRDDSGLVTQRDLEELEYFERRMKDAAALWRTKHGTILRCLELGCRVERGPRSVMQLKAAGRLVVR